MRHIAIYARVSTRRQDTKSQEPDLLRWAEAYADGQAVTWYRDKFTGRTMDRPGWKRLEAGIDAGQVSTVVVWRLDRLGRTASGLTTLALRKVGLVSIKDGLDLSTPAGRLVANMLASVACYENEVRAERIVAGQAAARAEGKRWGGSTKGRRVKVTQEQTTAVKQLRGEGGKVAAIARATGLSRPTIYSLLATSS